MEMGKCVINTTENSKMGGYPSPTSRMKDFYLPTAGNTNQA